MKGECSGCGKKDKLSMKGMCADCTWILAMRNEPLALREQILELTRRIEELTQMLEASQQEQRLMIEHNTTMRFKWNQARTALNKDRANLVKAYRKIKDLEVQCAPVLTDRI